jgi:hypothetical protein
MEPRTPPVRSLVGPLGAGAVVRVAIVGGGLLALWAAIGRVLGWWG